MRLTKVIPRRRKTVTLEWVRRSFFPNAGAFQSIRARKGEVRSSDRRCWWCRREFQADDTIALAGIKGQRNRILCDDCAIDAIRSADDDIGRAQLEADKLRYSLRERQALDEDKRDED